MGHVGNAGRQVFSSLQGENPVKQKDSIIRTIAEHSQQKPGIRNLVIQGH